MNEIISALFQARDIAHMLHLKTKSFAAHMALGDFYEAIITHADTLAEMYQGQYGILDLENCVMPTFDRQNPVSFICSVADWATSEPLRNQFNNDSHIQSEWDVVVTLILSTKYKLENLS